MSPRTHHKPRGRNSIGNDSSEQSSFFSTSTPKRETKVSTERSQEELGDSAGANPTAAFTHPLKSVSKPQRLRVKRNTLPRERRGHRHCFSDVRDTRDNKLTEEAIVQELGQWIRQKFAGEQGERWANAFISASLLPPVTRKSLSELDMSAMIGNAKLRHDINLDTDLHFRPNFDGEKGREKLQGALEYWLALRAELELYNSLRDDDLPESCKGESRTRIVKACQRRLPTMFHTIRDILKILVPEKDQRMVDEQFDVPMLMQQIERYVCDLSSLARWLAQLLKAHCAPMRDDWIDKTVEQIEMAVQTSQSECMVEALREVLGILEAMKLDVANHQIRHLRPLLIEDTINFEQKYHLSRIERDRIKINASQLWFYRERQRACQMDPSAHRKDPARFRFKAFLHAFLRLLLTDDSRNPFPETFSMDFDRLRGLKSELEDFVYFDICCKVFNDTVRKLDCIRQPHDSTYQRLRLTLFTIVKQAGPSSNGQWHMNLDNIAVELVRQAHQECQLSDPYDTQLVQLTGQSLKLAFCSRRPIHSKLIRRFIFPQLSEIAERYLNLSPIDMYNSLIVHAVPPPPPPPSSSTHFLAVAPIWSQYAVHAPQIPHSRMNHLAGITRRIAHIAILHWRIWEPIVYNRVNGETISPSNISSAAASISSSNLSGTAASSATISKAEVSGAPSLSQQRQSSTEEAIPKQQHVSSMQNADVGNPVSKGITESHNGDSGPLSNADEG